MQFSAAFDFLTFLANKISPSESVDLLLLPPLCLLFSSLFCSLPFLDLSSFTFKTHFRLWLYVSLFTQWTVINHLQSFMYLFSRWKFSESSIFSRLALPSLTCSLLVLFYQLLGESSNPSSCLFTKDTVTDLEQHAELGFIPGWDAGQHRQHICSVRDVQGEHS